MPQRRRGVELQFSWKSGGESDASTSRILRARDSEREAWLEDSALDHHVVRIPGHDETVDTWPRMANISYADTKSMALNIAQAFAEQGRRPARQ